ncbi:hypothetical protein D6C83_04153 [Aureobasidium pullulans]|uniref:Uncharacterized protein n=1 Tax=Aureobasidium pullulans TaxID=5580 RepID=A0A4T0D3Y9_AURPU|nr:hypothetical protein D6C83_04153 [Aureobasidium pullulans]
MPSTTKDVAASSIPMSSPTRSTMGIPTRANEDKAAMPPPSAPLARTQSIRTRPVSQTPAATSTSATRSGLAAPSRSLSTRAPAPSTATAPKPRVVSHSRTPSTSTIAASSTGDSTLKRSATTTATRHLRSQSSITTGLKSRLTAPSTPSTPTSEKSSTELTKPLVRRLVRPTATSNAPKLDPSTSRPAFNTLQQHYSPAKTVLPKPPVPSSRAAPSAEDKAVQSGAVFETTKLQSELLYLSLLHESAEPNLRSYERSARKALKRKFHYDRTMFDLKVRQGCVSLSRAKSRTCGKGDTAKRSLARGDGSESNITRPMNPFWQERPLCGASIGAYLPDHGHLEPVSFGGIVKVDDKEYGMSVHHMLEPPTDEEEYTDSESDSDIDEQADQGATRSSARASGQTLPRLATGSNHDHGYMSDLSSVSGADSDDDGYISSDFESDVSEDEGAGDRPGVTVSSSTTIQVTQPAFGDAVAEDLHADDATTEELDEDHLASYKLGKVYASSGLRRWNQDGRRFEIDWALLELEPPRLQPYNLIQGGRRHCKSPISNFQSADATIFTLQKKTGTLLPSFPLPNSQTLQSTVWAAHPVLPVVRSVQPCLL